jgi:hypothetical protein
MVYIKCSLYNDVFELERKVLVINSVGTNLRKFLSQYGIYYRILERDKYIEWQVDMNGMEEMAAGQKFDNLIKLSKTDVHRMPDGKPNGIVRLCYKEFCKIASIQKHHHIYHVYGKTKKIIYAGLHLNPMQNGIVSGCHHIEDTDRTTLGPYLIENNIELDESDRNRCGITFAKQKEEDAQRGETIAILALTMMTSEIDDYSMINKLIHCPHLLKKDDFADLQTHMGNSIQMT